MCKIAWEGRTQNVKLQGEVVGMERRHMAMVQWELPREQRW